MIQGGLDQFSGKNILLLQGPIGPFFSRLASDLEEAGARVFKINFNGGDWLFYCRNSINFRLHPNEWPSYLYDFLKKNNINVLFLFGDCRPLHRVAHQIALKLNIDIGVFEEGYIRPDYITFERYGVNSNSLVPSDPDFYTQLPEIPLANVAHVGKSFWYAAMWGMIYYAASVSMRPYFKYYQHHKILSIWQGLFWIRSLWRKWLFSYQQKNVLKEMTSKHDQNYFLLPLQVHNDAQIHHHSEFYSIDAFISFVINSFAQHAPNECQLVIKHHPLDRGFHDYHKLIDVVCNSKELRSRVHYVHDLHLPTLLNHARGVVVVNSTVGLSALIHNCPVIPCGNAIYDIEGLTYQGSLDTFWKESLVNKPDEKLLNKFLSYLISRTQLNGNFYKRLKNTGFCSGLAWKQKINDLKNRV